MISAQAQSSIRRILFNAVRSRLVLDPADHCDIRPLEQGSDAGTPGECNACVLTISAMDFRLILVLHVSPTEETQNYYVRDQVDKPFEEVFLEITNLCCGAINQELIHYFPDLGMSTPYMLSNHCMRFIDSLKPSHLNRFAVVINDSVKICATICMCAHAPIDFVYDASAVEVESGALEMF